MKRSHTYDALGVGLKSALTPISRGALSEFGT